MIAGPDRLVIDIPNTVPGAALRGMVVNRGEVKGVRVGLFSAAPPVTRIVVDLNSPQPYNIVPNSSGFGVSLGNNGKSVADAPTIGWVSAKRKFATSRGQKERRKCAVCERHAVSSGYGCDSFGSAFPDSETDRRGNRHSIGYRTGP